jgi:hypothetical protein
VNFARPKNKGKFSPDVGTVLDQEKLTKKLPKAKTG